MSRRSETLRRAALDANRPRPSAIWLIYSREMRDQLRDRRTIFTIAILPILLYPLVGMLLLQIAQFSRQHRTTVCVVGTEHLQSAPTLLDERGFTPEVSGDDENLVVERLRSGEAKRHPRAIGKTVDEIAEGWVRTGVYDCVIQIPPTFSSTSSSGKPPAIRLLYNVASDQSTVARQRAAAVLGRWQNGWVRDRLTQSGYDLQLLSPFKLLDIDIAPPATREAAFWSKLLPFVMLVWAMTGAFYPAIDLVAGEKERGTLETLLCSPALRLEVVWGKLAAVTTFSVMTAVLNASSMLVTSTLVFQHIGVGGGHVGPPPVTPMLWLLLALLPLSALFSALALAVAAMAKSSKEGQYYLMPLMMVSLPLVMLPMLPGMTLSAATGLIPVSGMFLLVRALIEGQYAHAIWHLPIVLSVTGACLYFAVNWARRQFDDEAVLVGSGEQWELGKWVRHLWRDRQTAATIPQAYACGAIILVTLFFARLAITDMPTNLIGIAKLVVIPQIALIGFPAILMAMMLTTSLRKSLRLRMPHWTTLPLSVLLGVTLHPTYLMLSGWVSHLYPISEQATAAMKPFTDQIAAAPWLTIVFVMAVVPAICEELAFRGFIFGGLVRDRGHVRAVLVTAVMFGVSHGVLQQSICASVMGGLLGWVALRTGSVLPCMLIHVTNNALSVSLPRIAASEWGGRDFFLQLGDAGVNYQPFWIVISMAVAITLILYFGTLRSSIDEADVDRMTFEPRADLAPA